MDLINRYLQAVRFWLPDAARSFEERPSPQPRSRTTRPCVRQRQCPPWVFARHSIVTNCCIAMPESSTTVFPEEESERRPGQAGRGDEGTRHPCK